jgi:sugar (pentulose or hexulose) kinase
MKKEVILIFDIGKTNKKVLLFDRNLRMVREEEERFKEVTDDEGFPCDDADHLEEWIRSAIEKFLHHEEYLVKGINFSTYGATLVCLDDQGRRLTPLYNYLKPLPGNVLEGFYESQGGQEEFSRRTASPALGMLNSGLQLLWLKQTRPELFSKVRHILHLPQYLAFLIHGKIVSEPTSIGCHTAMWDFDTMAYHPWLEGAGIQLPEPCTVSDTFSVKLEGREIICGIGIHDSSASLAPYILASTEPFILVSTGTWSIHMNPFNNEPLTTEELREDCLCFLGVHGKPVKSSRLFLGPVHDRQVASMQEHFRKGNEAYKNIDPARRMIADYWESGVGRELFFNTPRPQEWLEMKVDPGRFGSFEQAYTRLMVDLCRRVARSIRLILSEEDTTKHLYITGGFARNSVFNNLLALAFPDKELFASVVDNASSLGAALVISGKIWRGSAEQLNLGLTTPAPHLPRR